MQHIATSMTGLDLLADGEENTDPTPVLGCGKKYTAQWRPQNINQQVTMMLNDTLKNLAERLQPPRPKYKMIPPTFEGVEWEDPQEFLRLAEKYCLQENYLQEEWVCVIMDLLRGEAYRWAEDYRRYHITFEQFRLMFLEKYDSIAVRTRLQARLYGQKQGREDTAIFIEKKLALYKRLVPGLSELIMVQQIRELILPEIRMTLRGANIHSINQFIQLASEMETDLRELHQRPQISRSATTDLVQNRENQFVRRPSPSAQQRERGPPYPCQYCQGSHFHRDCPRRRAIEPASSSSTANDSENSRRAALPVTMTPRPQTQ